MLVVRKAPRANVDGVAGSGALVLPLEQKGLPRNKSARSASMAFVLVGAVRQREAASR